MGISKRLKFADQHGITWWSEAPAEGIFSILWYIIEHKPSLSAKHMIELTIIEEEGPLPASNSAASLTNKLYIIGKKTPLLMAIKKETLIQLDK